MPCTDRDRLAYSLAATTELSYLSNRRRRQTSSGPAAYSPTTFKRLRELKEKYDPDNFFRVNQNIGPR